LSNKFFCDVCEQELGAEGYERSQIYAGAGVIMDMCPVCTAYVIRAVRRAIDKRLEDLGRTQLPNEEDLLMFSDICSFDSGNTIKAWPFSPIAHSIIDTTTTSK
jgi:hypothetical protein